MGDPIVLDAFNHPCDVYYAQLYANYLSLNSLYSYACKQLAFHGLQYSIGMIQYDEWSEVLKKRYHLAIPQSDEKDNATDATLLMWLDYQHVIAEEDQLKQDLGDLLFAYQAWQAVVALERDLIRAPQKFSKRQATSYISIVDGYIQAGPAINLTNPLVIQAIYHMSPIWRHTYGYDVYYDFLAETCYAGEMPTVSWTFVQGLSRETEIRFLPLFINGTIEATTPIGQNIQCALRSQHYGHKRPMDWVMAQTASIKANDIQTFIRDNEEDVLVCGVDDYHVYYQYIDDISKEFYLPLTKNNRPAEPQKKKFRMEEVPVVIGSFAFDSDTKAFLPSINCAYGLSGEFSREPQYEGQCGLTLINRQYQRETFYRVIQDPSLYLEDIEGFLARQTVPIAEMSTGEVPIATLIHRANIQGIPMADQMRWEQNHPKNYFQNYWQNCQVLDKQATAFANY